MAASWKPDAKIVAAAIAGLVAGALQVWFGVDVFPGFEAGLAVVIAYLVPSTASRPIDEGVGLPYRQQDGHADLGMVVTVLVIIALVLLVTRLA